MSRALKLSGVYNFEEPEIEKDERKTSISGPPPPIPRRAEASRRKQRQAEAVTQLVRQCRQGGEATAHDFVFCGLGSGTQTAKATFIAEVFAKEPVSCVGPVLIGGDFNVAPAEAATVLSETNFSVAGSGRPT